MSRSTALAALALALLATPAAAITPEEAQQAELLKLRREVAGEVQLAAFDLLDELVYRWTQAPPFADATPVVVADVTVPVGLGTGLAGLLENHLAELLLANPATNVQLSACPTCTAVVVRSGPEGTVVSRGLDDPETLAKLGGPGGRHALYVDVAAEGAWLVLRARITRLTPDLPIVHSQTISSAVGAPSLLRHPMRLKSAAEAREEYLDALEDRSPFTIPIKFAVRTYAAGDSGIPPAPIIWLQTGFETALTQARRWTASIVLGYAWLPDAYDGFMVQSRMSRLISGQTRSLTGPDVYLFIGGALMTVDGQAVLLLSDEGGEGRGTFAGLHLGLEMRVGNRIGAAVFLENMPAFNDSTRVGDFVDFGLDFHSFGAEVSFCF